MQQSHAPHPASTTWRYPSRLKRFASMLYEGVLLFGVVFLADYLFDTLTQSRDGLQLRAGRQLLLFVAIGVYFVLSWHRRGQTLPMKTWHIKLVKKSGLRPSPGLLLARYLLVWPLPLFTLWIISSVVEQTDYTGLYLLMVFTPFSLFIWTWFDADRQFLHDRLLGTRLIDTRSQKAPSTAPANSTA